jgi:peptidoglycan hydrolase-like protein with peptidoglycan-binding domain
MDWTDSAKAILEQTVGVNSSPIKVAKAVVKTTVSEASVRICQWTDQMRTRTAKPGVAMSVYGYARGERVRGSDIWFNVGDGWVHSSALALIDTSFSSLRFFPAPLRTDPARERAEMAKLKVRADEARRGILEDAKQVIAGKVKPNHFRNNFQVLSETRGSMSIHRPQEFKRVQSAYEVAVAQGFSGTEEEFIRALQGEHGLTMDGAWGPETQRAIQGYRRVATPEMAERTGQPIGSMYAPNPFKDPPTGEYITDLPRKLGAMTEEQMQEMIARERDLQANMGYRIGPHPRFFGWLLVVDRHDGATQHYWRPTEEIAHRTGHKALEKYVERRKRAWAAANPKLVTARDRWIIEPTQAEQTAKETADWDAKFRAAEEGKQ